jgi:hypothetical protein
MTRVAAVTGGAAAIGSAIANVESALWLAQAA